MLVVEIKKVLNVKIKNTVKGIICSLEKLESLGGIKGELNEGL